MSRLIGGNGHDGAYQSPGERSRSGYGANRRKQTLWTTMRLVRVLGWSTMYSPGSEGGSFDPT
jgi:hypothetical protein